MATNEFISTTEAANRHGVTRAWVKKLASTGRIPGAMKLSQRAWAIPKDWKPTRQRNRARKTSDEPAA